MSWQHEERRIESGQAPSTPFEIAIRYIFWIIVGGGLLYFFDINIFKILEF